MEYLKFYKLDAEPFRSDPEERFYHDSADQRQARLRLLRGIYQRKALLLLVGPPGCGKTMLVRQLRRSLGGDPWVVMHLALAHSGCAAGWLLPRLARSLAITPVAEEPLRLLDQVRARLVEMGAKGARMVLLLDEAQLLARPTVLHEVRDLLGLVRERRGGLTLVLIGTPEVEEALRMDPSLAQQVEIRAELHGMSGEETRAYLEHRLRCAGARPGLFDPEAISALHGQARGTPRVVDTLADNTLFEGFLSQAPGIDPSLVLAAAEQLGLLLPPAMEISDVRADPLAGGDPARLLGEPTLLDPPVPPDEPAAGAPAASGGAPVPSSAEAPAAAGEAGDSAPGASKAAMDACRPYAVMGLDPELPVPGQTARPDPAPAVGALDAPDGAAAEEPDPGLEEMDPLADEEDDTFDALFGKLQKPEEAAWIEPEPESPPAPVVPEAEDDVDVLFDEIQLTE